MRKALRYSEAYPAHERDIINGNTASACYGILPPTLRDRVIYETRHQEHGSKDYLIKIIDIFNNEYNSAINTHDHKDSVQKAISIFKVNNNTVSSNNNNDKYKEELDDDINKFSNDILKHCNTSEACN